MAEGGKGRDTKGWVEGLDDGEEEELANKKKLRETVRQVLQRQRSIQDDQGPIVALPQLSRKWSTLIDDTIASMRRSKGLVTPDPEDMRMKSRSIPVAFGEPPGDDKGLGPPPSYSSVVSQAKYRAPDESPPVQRRVSESSSSSFEENVSSRPTGPSPQILYTDRELGKNEIEMVPAQVPPGATVLPETFRVSPKPRRISYQEEPEEETAIDFGMSAEVYNPNTASRGATPASLSAVRTEVDRGATPEIVPEKAPLRDVSVIEAPTPSGQQENRDVEAGRTREKYVCKRLGPLNPVVTRMGQFCLTKRDGVDDGIRSLSVRRVIILIAVITGIIGLIVFLGVFPASFVYVEHHEIALLMNKVTGWVDRDTTYYPGCYVLGPDKEFIKFPGTAVTVSLTEAVFTEDKLEVTLSFHLQYFLKPSELGQLHRKFGTEYGPIIKNVIKARVKNSSPQFSLEQFRLNRTNLERTFFNIIRSRLEGTCCPECCPSCSNSTVCSVCDTSEMCDPIYHVEVRYFQMAQVSIASEVMERYMQSLLLSVQAETEFFKQEYKLEVKKTQRQVRSTKNEANELTQQGYAEAAKTATLTGANREANITAAYVTALDSMFTRLVIAREDYKTSLMMIRALEDKAVKGHLYRSYNYNNMSIANNFIPGSG